MSAGSVISVCRSFVLPVQVAGEYAPAYEISHLHSFTPVTEGSHTALHVLLVEDDKELASFMQRALEEEHCVVRVCSDGAAGLRQAGAHNFDVILLDVMLPGRDGFDVTRRLRLKQLRTPIILLTGRDAPEDVIQGLDAGADDYLTKPFVFDVLLARIRARTRSRTGQASAQMRFADLLLDSDKHEAMRGGKRLELTRTEFAILECLMRSAGNVVRRSRLVDAVWGDRDISENNLDVFIRFLRMKLDLPGLPRLLHTERGLGYSIREPKK